jgi:uncharacterized membrane protein YdjX (TVP38/TMEM64 family)
MAWGPLGLLLLAAIDSAGVPVPGGVDALIILLCMQNPALALICTVLSVAGSLAGCMVLFYIARKGGELYLERQTSSPRGQRLRRWFQKYGLLTVFIPALVPIPMPMKLFVVCAGAMGISPAGFAVVVLAARIPRYAALAYLGAAMRENALGYLRTHVPHFVAIAAALFVFLYLLVRVHEARKARR